MSERRRSDSILDMSPETLRNLIVAHPFVPFTLRLADGRSYHVPHPEFVSVSRSGRTAKVSTEEFAGEGTEFLDVFQLLSVGLRDPDTANLPPENGSGSTPPSAPQ